MAAAAATFTVTAQLQTMQLGIRNIFRGGVDDALAAADPAIFNLPSLKFLLHLTTAAARYTAPGWGVFFILLLRCSILSRNFAARVHF